MWRRRSNTSKPALDLPPRLGTFKVGRKYQEWLFCARYSNISCELLTSDIGQVNDRLGEDEKLLMKLYGFLQNEPPLNPLLASFFSKVLSILIGRKPERVSC